VIAWDAHSDNPENTSTRDGSSDFSAGFVPLPLLTGLCDQASAAHAAKTTRVVRE
jgi:hypothetical protein